VQISTSRNVGVSIRIFLRTVNPDDFPDVRFRIVRPRSFFVKVLKNRSAEVVLVTRSSMKAKLVLKKENKEAPKQMYRLTWCTAKTVHITSKKRTNTLAKPDPSDHLEV